MQTAEKRKNRRRTIRYPGSIELGDGAPSIQCTLCDASREGAQLVVDDPKHLPDKFSLVLGYDGTARRLCRVKWRTETQVGVEFVTPPQNARPWRTGPARDRVAEANDSPDIDRPPLR